MKVQIEIRSSNLSHHIFQHNVCNFLDETISPVEQAEALGISVDLYNKFVVIRKENGDYLEVWNQIRSWVRLLSWYDIIGETYSYSSVYQTSICKAIDESDGVSNKTYADEVVIGLSQEQEFLALISKADSVKNSKKIGRWVGHSGSDPITFFHLN